MKSLSPYWPFMGKSGLPIAILGCGWQSEFFCRGNHLIHRYLSSNKTEKVLGVFGGWEFHFENTPKIYKAAFLCVFSDLKPWNPLMVRSIWVVLIIFSQAFSHGHHLASCESCPTSWDIPLLSNHSIHSCFIKDNVKKGNKVNFRLPEKNKAHFSMGSILTIFNASVSQWLLLLCMTTSNFEISI